MFSAFFIKRPKFAMVISLFIMLAGYICYTKLPVAEYPEVAPPTIMVIGAYPGASSQVIAETVAAPLEAEINGIEDMVYYSSTSDNGGSYTLTLTFKSDADADMALVNVNNAVKRAEPKLPSEVTMNGLIVIKRTSDILGVLAFTSDNPEHTPLFLSNYVSINVKDAISRIDGVGQAVIFGEKAYSMRIWLDPLKMRSLDIGHEEVLAAIRSQNLQAASGSIGNEESSDFMQFKVDTQGRLREASEFEDIIVRAGEEGRQVRLGDIARVELGSESNNGTARLNGKPAVMLAVFRLSDANALQIANEVRTTLEKLSQNFPDGVDWVFGYDSTKFVIATMNEIVTTLIVTFILVILITYIFLQDWRATLVPAVAIPVSLIGTFLFMYLFDMSINTLTMFGLILVIGSVVDDAICVVECCIRLINEEKMSPMDAALQCMRELSGALVATTLVVVAVYAPIAFYGGMVGTIYKQFAATMCIALCLSTVVALTLSPAMCALVLRDSGEAKGFFRLFNIGVDWTRNAYLGIGGFLARRSAITVVLLAAILYGNYALFNMLPSAFLPQEDKGSLFCEMILPPAAALHRTEAVMNEFAAEIQQLPGVERVLAIPGRSMTSGEGENMCMTIVQLKDWAERTTVETQISSIQRELIMHGATVAEASVNAFVPPAIMGLGATGGVSFALQATGGQSYRDISEATGLLLSKIMESGKAIFAATSFDASTPMIDLKLDRAKAEALKVPVSSVFGALQSQLGSLYVNDFNMYGKTYKVKVQSEAEHRTSVNSIDQLTVASQNGTLVPIDAIATVDWALGPRQAERFNMFSSANVITQSMPTVSSGELMTTVQDLVRSELSNDYQISWTDMSYQETQNEGQILSLVVLAMVFAYLFLTAQYESWTTPISVILSVVTATLGGMVALWVSGRALDIYCQLGLLMLVGLTAKTAILMVEYAKQLRDEGQTLYEAAMNGMRVRFRSVMMTALSFVIGVSPMVIATGAGAGSRQSIGITTFWGMIAATVVGMVLIPSLYVITRSMSETTKKVIRKVFVSNTPVQNAVDANLTT